MMLANIEMETGRTGSKSPLARNVSSSSAYEKKLVRKIDLRVLPMLFVIYFIAFLDRVNISNALTMGLPAQLGLRGQQPNVALTIFFVPYVLSEIPSNILMKRLSPHIWITSCVSVFGVCTIAQGFVKNYGGILAVRFFLGMAEGGIFSGGFYLISFWYKREEAQRRFTFYRTSVIFAGAFGSLIASAIANMDGIRGLANWRWVFILEGIVAVLVAIVTFFCLSDFPVQAKWLSDEEKRLVREHTFDDLEEGAPVTVKAVFRFLIKPHAILGGLMYFSIVVPVYAFAYFTPTIIQALGYSVVQTQLHSVPPFAAALGTCMVTAFLSDRYKVRFPFVLFGNILLIIGLALLLSVHGKDNFSIVYLALHFVLMGSLSSGASIVCWCLMNLQGHQDRAIGSGWMIGFGNAGGVLATFTFMKQDAPLYHTGYSVLMAIAVLGIIASLMYTWLVVENRRRLESEDLVAYAL